MESDRTSTSRSDSVSDSQPKARLLQGRTYAPSRRSTKGQWTPEEDEILREAVQHFKGKNWKKIAQCFKDRTDVQCLHRWQKVLNPELVKGPWSKDEDDAIVELVKKQGPTKWSTIAQHLPGRIGKQCRERWHNHLNPNINKKAWTQEEELALIRAHQIYGNNWAELIKYLPDRSDNAIKNHWNSSVKKKLDSYMASGLLAQFQDLPNPIHTIQNVATCSKTPQISEEDSFARNGQPETEEVSQCSQGSAVVGFSQSTSDARNTTTNMPTGEVYLEYNLPVEWGGSMENDWRQLNQNNLPENPMFGQLIHSLSAQFHHLSTHFPFHSSGNMALATDESGCHFAPEEEGGKIIGLFPFQSGTMDGSAESLHYQSSTYQFPMDGTSTSTLQPCFSSFCQSFPDPSQPMSDPGSLIYGVGPIFFNDSTGLSEQNDLLERNDSFINTNDAYQEDNARMTEQLDQGLDTSRVTTVNGIGMESNKLNLRFIIDNKLDETNFLDCERNLKIILRHENISYVLDTPLTKDPEDATNEESFKKHAKHCSDSVEATCIILASMTPELQKHYESMDAYTIMTHLKELYASQSRTKRYKVSKALFGCKMAPGSSVGSHVLKMIGHIERLEKLGHKMERELSIDLILQSLPDSYSHFVMNYHMNKIDSSLAELLNMLKTAEGTVGKGKQVLLVASSKGKEKAQKKFKKVKEAVKPKPMIAKDKSKDACFHCSHPGHWRRNCKAFLNTKKNKHSDASTSDTKKD